MNVLFVSNDLSGGDLCLRLKNEGHNVRLFIEDEKQRVNYEGMVVKTDDWKKDIEWVGKDGLFVFDGIGYGAAQDELRANGYSVVGGCALSDKLEHERQYGQKIFSLCEIPIVSSINFSSPQDAIWFVKKNPAKWVVKQNGHVDKIFNYVGQLSSGEDVIDLLEKYCKNNIEECASIDLQRRIEGIEIGVARYFNGNDWVGPIEVNLEHKDLCAGNVGPKTYEMGTLMWYEDDDEMKLFKKMLAPLKPFLQKIGFKGDIDVNCIINEEGAFPLEVTPRFGWPATHLHTELHLSPWGEFLKAVADGKEYDLKYKKGYGIVNLVALPPFPYNGDFENYSPKGMRVYFKDEMTEKDFQHVHFEEVSMPEDGKYFVTGDSGFVLHVTEVGDSVAEARRKAEGIIKKIVLPKMFYRNDIGIKFINEDEKKLREWGWI